MAVSIVMPALEMAQETGKLLAWRKRQGERVTKGEPLLEIETDKAVVEIEAPGDGVLAGVTAHEGAVVPVGQTIAWLVAPGEAVPTDEASVPAQTGPRGRAEAAAAASAVPGALQSTNTNQSASRNPPTGKSVFPQARAPAQDTGA